MRNNINFENARLIEALDYIDRDLIAEVIDDIKVPDMSAEPERDKKATRRSIRYALTLAASLILISAIIPALTYIIQHFDLFPAGVSSGTTEESSGDPDVTVALHEENAPYPIFTPDLEPISAEMIEEVKNAFYTIRYDKEYQSLYSIYVNDSRYINREEQLKNDISVSAQLSANNYISFFFSEKKKMHFIGRYYGTINNCVIMARNTYLENEYNIITIGNTKITNDYSFYLFAYRNGELETLENAYANEWLTDKDIEKIKERHDQFNAYGYWKDETPTQYHYAKFTPDLEEISIELIEEINLLKSEQAYHQYFDQSSNPSETGNEEEIRTQREESASYAYSKALSAGSLFKLNDSDPTMYEYYFRYYGIFNNKVVWASVSMMTAVTEYSIAGYDFFYSTDTITYVYANGKIMTILQAYNDGLFTEDEIALLHARYLAYEEYLESPQNGPVPIKPDSAICDFPGNASVDEVFAEIKKGGWVVINDGVIESGIELWYDFFDKASRGEEASVLIATYSSVKLWQNDTNYPKIFLYDIRYNGSSYNYLLDIFPYTNNSISESEYKYIVKYELENKDVYIMVNKNTYTYEQLMRAATSSQHTELINHTTIISIPK